MGKEVGTVHFVGTVIHSSARSATNRLFFYKASSIMKKQNRFRRRLFFDGYHYARDPRLDTTRDH